MQIIMKSIARAEHLSNNIQNSELLTCHVFYYLFEQVCAKQMLIYSLLRSLVLIYGFKTFQNTGLLVFFCSFGACDGQETRVVFESLRYPVELKIHSAQNPSK